MGPKGIAAFFGQAKATPHDELIRQIMDSRVSKSEREHAAAREIARLRTERTLLQKILDQGWSVTFSKDGELYSAFAVPSDHEDIKIAASDAEEDGNMTDHPTVDQCVEWLEWKLLTQKNRNYVCSKPERSIVSSIESRPVDEISIDSGFEPSERDSIEGTVDHLNEAPSVLKIGSMVIVSNGHGSLQFSIAQAHDLACSLDEAMRQA